jgi:DNA-binding transcriptional LysR family regulator
MNGVNLAAIDLNLLVVLEAVLEAQSATRAAARLHVTQSAVSSSLRRLRALFGDPLVVRTAYGFVPTARAAALLPKLRALLGATRELLSDERASDGGLCARSFVIACSDAVSVTVLPALLGELHELPGARLRVVTLEQAFASDGLSRGDVDLLIGIPPTLPPGCRSELVYEDEMVCLVARAHPTVRKRLTLDQYASLPHAEVTFFGNADDRVDRALARAGKTRNIALTVPHFAVVPFAVANTDCISTMSRRLAAAYANGLPIRLLEAPVELPSLRIHQIWHRRADDDPGLKRLRALIRRSVAARPAHARPARVRPDAAPRKRRSHERSSETSQRDER